MHDTRLVRMELHSQLGQNFTRRRHCCPRLRRRFTGNHPIVGPARELISLASHLPVKRRQENVTEQGRDYPALRSPALGWKEPSLTITAGREERPNKAQQAAVGYALSHQREKMLVVDPPEEVFQIGLHHPLPSALNLPPHLAHCVFGGAPSPIAEVGIIEYQLKDRLQPIEQRLLAYAVTHRRYT